MNITHEWLLDHIDYDQTNGVLTWIRKPHWRSPVEMGDVAGCKHHSGYIVVRVKNKIYQAHRLIWFYMHGEWPDKNIDHINGIKSDNRIENLRLANSSENQCNRRSASSNNKSGFPGVGYIKSRGKFRASIKLHGKVQFIGEYDDAKLAHDAYLKRKREIHSFCTI